MIDKKIHIVQMIHGLPYGGAERCVVDIVNNADPNKFKFTILVFRHLLVMKKEIKNSEVEVVVVEKRGKVDFSLGGRIKKELQRLQPDIVHTHLFTADLWGRRAARKLNIPVVTTEHNVNAGDGWARNFLKRMTSGYTQKYIACSESVKKYMQSVYGITKEIKVARYGVDLERFAEAGDLQMSPPFKLVMIGRLTKQKGQAVALVALKDLRDFDWKLEIVGEGELKGCLEKMVKRYNLTERVRFLPPSDQIPKILADHHILLMPSLWEGLGIVVMEAMASGRLVIGSRVGGIPELIKDGETGFLVKPNDAKSLAKKLRWCFEHTTEVENVARAARNYARENFAMARAIDVYEKIYLETYGKK